MVPARPRAGFPLAAAQFARIAARRPGICKGDCVANRVGTIRGGHAMRKWIIAIGLVVLANEAHELYAQMQLRQLMANKLQTSQRLLEAIALSDFTKIGAQADQLSQLATQAEWLAFKTPRYELHSNEFRRAAETIARKAKEKNIDGVTLAYMDLTMSCVRCHQYVREVRDASLPIEPPSIAFAPRPRD
jgi:hypothetical protein